MTTWLIRRKYKSAPFPPQHQMTIILERWFRSSEHIKRNLNSFSFVYDVLFHVTGVTDFKIVFVLFCFVLFIFLTTLFQEQVFPCQPGHIILDAPVDVSLNSDMMILIGWEFSTNFFLNQFTVPWCDCPFCQFYSAIHWNGNLIK